MEDGTQRARLLAQVFQNRVVFLCEDTDRLFRMAATENLLREHVLLLCQRFCGRAVVNNVQGWLALEYQVEGPRVIMKALAGIYNVDLRVRPDPGLLVISVVVPHRGTQGCDVSKDLAVGAFKQI